MKLLILTLLTFISIVAVSHAQVSDTLGLSYDMRMNVVFKSKIKKISPVSKKVELHGSNDSLSLDCRAKMKNFTPSNILVTTIDGRIYNFILIYRNTPNRFYVPVDPQTAVNRDDFQVQSSPKEEHQSYEVPQTITTDKTVAFSNAPLVTERKSDDENSLLGYAKKVDKASRNIKRAGIIDKKIWFYPTALYFMDEYLFIKVKIENKSNITYDIDQFYIHRRYTGGGVATSSQQDLPMKIEYTYNQGGKTVKRKYPITFVFALKKFTLNDNEEFIIEMLEANEGSRDLSFKLTNEHILNAEAL